MWSVTNFTSELPEAVQVQVLTKFGVTCFPAPTGTPTAAPTWSGVNTVHASVSARAVEGIAAADARNGAMHKAAGREVLISKAPLIGAIQLTSGRPGQRQPILPATTPKYKTAWFAHARHSDGRGPAGHTRAAATKIAAPTSSDVAATMSECWNAACASPPPCRSRAATISGPSDWPSAQTVVTRPMVLAAAFGRMRRTSCIVKK